MKLLRLSIKKRTALSSLILLVQMPVDRKLLAGSKMLHCLTLARLDYLAFAASFNDVPISRHRTSDMSFITTLPNNAQNHLLMSVMRQRKEVTLLYLPPTEHGIEDEVPVLEL